MKTKRIFTLTLLIALVALCFSMQIFAGDLARGDMNGDGKVDSDDAIYLLRHTMLPDQYPLACDHETVIDAGFAPTCTETGLTDGSHCTSCGAIVVAQEEIPALGHDEIEHNGKNVSCTRNGWDAYVTCSRCEYTTYEEIPFLGHNYVNYVCTNCGAVEEVEGLIFTPNGDGTCYVSAIGYSIDADLVIPATSPDGDVVTGIGEYAFEYCTALTSVTIPDTVTSIGRDAFYDCTNLKAVYITDLAAWCDLVFETAKANPLYYAKNLYINGEKATSITIPDGVTSINDYAFYNCDWLTGITIPDSVINIGNSAFYDCDYLRNITIPDSVTSIGDYAFNSCDSLTSVTIPDSVTTIGEWAFSSCTRLRNLTIGNSVTSIGNYAFYCSGLTSVTIPDSVTSIGYGAFEYCSGLTSVYITDLAAWCGIAFENSTANPLYNGENLYLNGQVVTSLVIPDGVTSISADAFRGCGSITSVTIPNSVTGIGDYAFSNCSRLRRVTIGNGVTTIGWHAFSSCSSLTDIVVDEKNEAYCSIDGNLYTKDGKTLVQYAPGKPQTSFTIPDSVTTIGEWAFSDCTSLTSVTIPDSVTSIGRYAFSDCSSLTSVTFSDTDTWYRTASSSYTGGSQIDVTDAAQNATYFKDTYYNYYLYKK